MSRTATASRALAAGLLAAAIPAVAQDMLPLRRGFYVREPATCAQASAATLAQFTGRGFNAGQAECRITQMSRAGNVFTIRQDCRDLRSAQPVPGDIERVTLTQSGFERLAGGQVTAWRYCPQAQLPSPWRSDRIE